MSDVLILGVQNHLQVRKGFTHRSAEEVSPVQRALRGNGHANGTGYFLWTRMAYL